MPLKFPSFLLFSILILLSTAGVSSVANVSRGDPLVIDVLMMDRTLGQGGQFYKRLAADPCISILAVPQLGHYSIFFLKKNPNVINRAMRIYMPRNYRQLVDNRDLILLREASCGSIEIPEIIFDQDWMSWFVRAVREEGLSFAMWGGDASWGGGGEGDYKSWGETMLDDILPFKSLGGYTTSKAEFQRPDFADPDHPLTRLPWGDSGPVELLNRVQPKGGAKLVASAVGPGSLIVQGVGSDRKITRSPWKDFPWIAWWEQGEGRVLGEAQVFGSCGTTDRMLNDWRWYNDFIVYLLYFGVGKELPDDIFRAHRLRVEINTYQDRASLYLSLLEFLEKFGASTLELYREFDEVNQMEREAELRFRQEDYDGAAEIFEEINEAWAAIDSKALDAKKRALSWVYLIEWFSVTGAAMIVGALLWALMVKRKLYKEIQTTRPTSL